MKRIKPVTTMQVLSPIGGAVVKERPAAPRLGDLSGKTVCELWNGQYKGDHVFPILRELIGRRYPDAKVIPYTEFPLFYAGDTPKLHAEFARQLAALAKEKGCDAVITGNGA